MHDFYNRMLNVFKFTDAPFLLFGNESFKYKDIYHLMTKYNYHLKNHHQKKIVVFADKTRNAYAALYSIILSGNIWIPINPLNPENRSIEMIQLASPTIIMTDRALPPILFEYAKKNSVLIIDLSSNQPDEAMHEFNFDKNGHSKDDLAYIMFTSGSTGSPKGVPMTHGNFIPFIENALKLIPLQTGDVFCDYHDFSFDISIFYLFCSIFCKGAIAPYRSIEEVTMPIDHLIRNGVTVMATIPSTLLRIKMFARSKQIKTSLRVLFVCGEPFRLDLLEFALDKLSVPNIFNFYGLTETGVENFYHTCQRSDLEKFSNMHSIPIGKPLPGNIVAVDDESGELLLSGVQITPGYLGNVGNEKFFLKDGTRWFRTGDRVNVVDGFYFCDGRLDSQVKFKGYRIELKDIEANIRKFDGVDEAVCFIADSKLVAAIRLSHDFDVKKIREHLTLQLPSYMIPTEFYKIDTIPINRAGKIDRNAIKQMLFSL